MIGSAIITAISAAMQINASNKQNRAQKQAAKAQQEANNTAAAGSKNEQTEQTRQQIRDNRIRIAQIEALSQNQGTSGSSGQIGAVNNLQGGLANQMSYTNMNNRTSDGISYWNSEVAGYQSTANHWASMGQVGAGIGQFAGVAEAVGKNMKTPTLE